MQACANSLFVVGRSMNVTTTRSGPVTVVAVAGRLDHASVTPFQSALAPQLAACSASGAPLLLDLSQVAYVSSVGLRALMLVARAVGAYKGRVALAGAQPVVHDVLEISRFHLVIQLYDTVESGVAALS